MSLNLMVQRLEEDPAIKQLKSAHAKMCADDTKAYVPLRESRLIEPLEPLHDTKAYVVHQCNEVHHCYEVQRRAV